MDSRIAKKLARLALEAIGDQEGSGFGSMAVVEGKSIKTLTFTTASQYKEALRKVISGELVPAAL